MYRPTNSVPKWGDEDYEKPTFLVPISEEIDELMEKIPDKRKIEYRKWRDHINSLMMDYNKIAKFEAYVLYE